VPSRARKNHQFQGHHAIADLHGNQVPVSTVLVPETEPGDWVLVHAGFAIQRLDAAEAQQTFAVIKDLEEAGRQSGGSA